MKYAAGTIDVTPGSNVIVGTGTAWLSTDRPWMLDTKIPKYLTVDHLGMVFRVLRVTEAGELLISRGFPALPGSPGSMTNLNYSIAADFSAGTNIPLPRQDDIDKAGMLRRGLAIIDQRLLDLL